MNVEATLREKFGAPEYAFFEQVSNGTGFGPRVRYADACALSLWPSRGIHLHGFEVKKSRTDWVREKDDPAKAEEIARFCSFWWLVVSDRAIVKDGELPPAWGLIAPGTGRQADSLVVVKRAEQRDAQAPTWSFVAAFLRRAADAHDSERRQWVPAADVEKRGEEIAKREVENAVLAVVHDRDEWKRKADAAQKLVDDFQKESGLRLSPWDAGKIGNAVRSYMETIAAGESLLKSARRFSEQAELAAKMAKEQVEELERFERKAAS